MAHEAPLATQKKPLPHRDNGFDADRDTHHYLFRVTVLNTSHSVPKKQLTSTL